MGYSDSTIDNTKEPNIPNELENQKSSNTSDDNAVQRTLENTVTSKSNSIEKIDISKTLDSHQNDYEYYPLMGQEKSYNRVIPIFCKKYAKYRNYPFVIRNNCGRGRLS
jgi:hypothetical protein